MGFKIITREHKKAPKCQNIAVGPVPSRRIPYLHTVLQKNEMIPQIYEAQKENSKPVDFINLVNNDFELIGLKMSEYEIKHTNKKKKIRKY